MGTFLSRTQEGSSIFVSAHPSEEREGWGHPRVQLAVARQRQGVGMKASAEKAETRQHDDWRRQQGKMDA
jgi:hypothetical protein